MTSFRSEPAVGTSGAFDYLPLRMKAREYANVERMALATANWLRHRFVPEFLLPAHGEMKDALRTGRSRLKRELEQTMEGHVCSTYIDDTRGLGRFGCGLVIGNLPERIEDYRTIGEIGRASCRERV